MHTCAWTHTHMDTPTDKQIHWHTDTHTDTHKHTQTHRHTHIPIKTFHWKASSADSSAQPECCTVVALSSSTNRKYNIICIAHNSRLQWIDTQKILVGNLLLWTFKRCGWVYVALIGWFIGVLQIDQLVIQISWNIEIVVSQERRVQKKANHFCEKQ